MLIFYFWILIWIFSLSINCSVIKSASNVTYCDINTQICEAYLTTVAALQAPSDQLSFRTLDNAELKVYFDNITVSYATTATEKASFVDGVLNSYRYRTCPAGWSAFADEADPYPCQFINVMKDDRVIHKISHRYRYGNNEQNCKCCGDSWVCYAFYIDQPSYYTYYTGFTSQVDKLHFIYKGKPYSVSQLETIELPDMNFTFQTGEAMTFAFENTLILINTATSEYLFRRRDTINSPTEFNERKAGYWRDNNTLLQKIADDKILTGWKPNYWSEGDDVWGISKLSDFEDNNNIDFSISCPNDVVRYTNELKKALILGYSPNAKGAKNIYYDIGVQATTNIQINGFIVQLCVDYPTICICNTLNPLTCLDFEGEIRIRNEVSRNQAKAYLKGNRLYSSDACKDPIFKTSRVPLWIEVIISGANIIPKIDVSQCKPSVFINYDTSVLYLKANCSILPCRINSDTGFTFNFTVSDKEIKIDLESSFQWISVTCLRWTKRYYKDQSEDVTNENGNPTSNNTGSGSSYGGGPSGGLGFLDGILDTITDIGGSILDFILTPLTWIWDFLSAPLEWLLNLWNTIMNNLLFWALMILGGLISLCINGFLFTIILEIVSYQVYKQTTAYTALLTMGGMVVVFKLWQWYRSSKSSATKTQVIKEVEVPLIK